MEPWYSVDLYWFLKIRYVSVLIWVLTNDLSHPLWSGSTFFSLFCFWPHWTDKLKKKQQKTKSFTYIFAREVIFWSFTSSTVCLFVPIIIVDFYYLFETSSVVNLGRDSLKSTWKLLKYYSETMSKDQI